MSKTKASILYLLGDLVFTAIAWGLFSYFRYETIADFNQSFASATDFFMFHRTLQVHLVVSLFWLVIFYFSGFYNKPFRKMKVDIFLQTLLATVVGSLFIFFLVFLNDNQNNNTTQYMLIGTLLIITFVCVVSIRFLIAGYLKLLIEKGKIKFKAIVVGTGKNDLSFFRQINKTTSGYDIVGYVNHSENKIKNEIPENLILQESQIEDFIRNNRVDEILINGLNIDETNINEFYYYYRFHKPVKVQKNAIIAPFRLNYLKAKTSELKDLYKVRKLEAEDNIGRFLDIVISSITLIIISPILLLIAIWIKLDSNGPIIYKQERVGMNGRIFKVLKFRSMRTDAEAAGPALSQTNDDRITNSGKILRKYRLDELPQFWNVVKGDMAIIGPRPEREYYIEKIAAFTPLVYLLQLVRPGITSQAAVENGYTRNVQEMVVRTEIDIQYLENASLYTDFKVLLQTIYVIVKGRGI